MTRTTLAAFVLAGALGLTACSGSDSSDAGAGSDGVSSSATPYLPVPDGVELTPPGSQLSVGDSAVVAYHPRQDDVAALDIQVTSLEKAPIKAFSAWQLTDAALPARRDAPGVRGCAQAAARSRNSRSITASSAPSSSARRRART